MSSRVASITTPPVTAVEVTALPNEKYPRTPCYLRGPNKSNCGGWRFSVPHPSKRSHALCAQSAIAREGAQLRKAGRPAGDRDVERSYEFCPAIALQDCT